MAEMKLSEPSKALLKEVEGNKAKLPEVVLKALVQNMSALYQGITWTLVGKSDPDYAIFNELYDNTGTIKSVAYGTNVYIWHVRDGGFIYMDLLWYKTVLHTLAPNWCKTNWQILEQNVLERESASLAAFDKYWDAAINQVSTDFFANRAADGNAKIAGMFGLLGQNSSNRVVINGIDYKAFGLTPMQWLERVKVVTVPSRIALLSVNDCIHNTWIPLTTLLSMRMEERQWGVLMSVPRDFNNNIINRPHALTMIVAGRAAN